MRKQLRGTAGISSSSRDVCERWPESTDMLSREEDELRELLDLLESTFLTFSLAQFSMMPAKGQHKQHPKKTRIKKSVSI